MTKQSWNWLHSSKNSVTMDDDWYRYPPVETSYTVVVTGGFDLAVRKHNVDTTGVKKLPSWLTWMPSTDNIDKPQV